MKLNKIFSAVLALAIIFAFFAACDNSEQVVERGGAAVSAPVAVIGDADGNDGAVGVVPPNRVFVLDHSALDIMDALGLESYIVGVIGGRSASDAFWLQDYYDSPGISVLEVHGGGGGGSPVINIGGGVFASANTTIENSTIVGNRDGDDACDIVNAPENFDGGGNTFGTVNGAQHTQVNHETLVAEISANVGSVPVLAQTPGSGVTSWEEFTAAVDAAAPGSTVEIGASLSATSVLLIENDVVIEGNGFTVSKTPSIVGAVFLVKGDASVTFQNIVMDGQNLSEPHDSTDYDGGMISANANLTIRNSVFKNGFARMITGGVGRGGAINSRGTLTVIDSHFYNNQGVRAGGAIWSSGELTVSGSTFVGNREERSGGGAISASGPTVIYDSIFYGNFSVLGSVSGGSQGGAIWLSGSASIENSTIVGNAVGVMPAVDGGVETPNDRFFTIDADMIIGGPGQSHLYDEVFSIIAPTILIDSPREHASGVLEGVIEATRDIASIWGIESQAEEIIAALNARHDALAPIVSQRSGMSVQLNAANGGFLLASETLTQQSLPSAMGFNNLAHESVPTHFHSAGAMRDYAIGQDIETRDVMMMFLEWVEEQNPEYIIIFDNSFASLEEAEAAGGDFYAIRELSAYRDGRIMFQRHSSSTFGLTRMDLQLQDLENMFL